MLVYAAVYNIKNYPKITLENKRNSMQTSYFLNTLMAGHKNYLLLLVEPPDSIH